MFYETEMPVKKAKKTIAALVSLTPSESKRLIALAVSTLPEVKEAYKKGLIVIARGSTNAYIAEELLGITIDNKADEYCRGLIVDAELHANKKPHTERKIGYDFVLRKGKLEEVDFKEIMDQFRAEDVFIKGANAVDNTGDAAVLAAGAAAGTIGKALPAVIFAAAHFIVPVGLEKLIPSVSEAVQKCGAFHFKYSTGLPCALVPIANAKVITEIQAFEILFGIYATHVASGGIAGSEGTVVLSIEGNESDMDKAFRAIKKIKGEAPIKHPTTITKPASTMNYDSEAIWHAMSS
jgi:hypothetical protein